MPIDPSPALPSDAPPKPARWQARLRPLLALAGLGSLLAAAPASAAIHRPAIERVQDIRARLQASDADTARTGSTADDQPLAQWQNWAKWNNWNNWNNWLKWVKY